MISLGFRRVAAIGAVCVAATAEAQVPERATFYLVAGSDTLVVERMTRLPNRLQLELVDAKRFGRVALTADLATSGLVTTVDARFFKSDRDTTPIQQTTVRFDADSVAFQSGGATNWLHIGKNAIPNVNPSAALLEQLLIRARTFSSQKVDLSFIYLPAGPEVPVVVGWNGTDSAVVRFAGVEMRLAACWAAPSHHRAFASSGAPE
jgi:hypothetical protein